MGLFNKFGKNKQNDNVQPLDNQYNQFNDNQNNVDINQEEDFLHLSGSGNTEGQSLNNDNRSSVEIASKNHADGLRKRLKFPATLLDDTQLNWYYEIGSEPKTIRQETMVRFGLAVAAGLVSLVFVTKNIFALAGVILLPLAIWFFSRNIVKSQYETSIFNKQLNFNKFISITTPYLAQIKDGVSITTILNDVSQRMDDKRTLNLIGRLVSGIRENPLSIHPYTEFSREMSNTQRANMFMTAVYQMSQGATSDETVKNISKQANIDLMKQVDKISEKKLKRFNKLPTLMVMDFGIYMIGFLGAILISIFSQVMKG